MENNKPAVLISIKPKWCELIANGAKTVEVRKTRPKLEAPFKCYIYCTKPDKSYQTKCGSMVLNDDELYKHPVEGIKHGSSIELMCRDDYSNNNFLNGKVIGEFVCDYIEDFKEFEYGIDALHRHIKLNACIGYREIYDYLGFAECGYGWHISDLVIYDKPKELSEFFNACDKPKGTDCSVCIDHRENKCKAITRPPMSWCYVEVME